ncbi:MAG: hypothetical protein ACTH5W_02895 [Providencia sp.]|uniref:hypothetical protein n=1 Tax=Providencia sp. TaxID=589 RepID=UPI003F9D46F3
MDVKIKFLEKSCANLSSLFSNYFDWNDIDLSFSRIDILNKEISIISNNYEWLLMYWDDDLDKIISERLSSGIQYWANYSNSYKNTLAKSNKNALKVDFCTKYGGVYEITSINSKKKLSIKDMIAIYKCRPIVSDYAHSTWKKDDSVILPQRENIVLPIESIGNQELQEVEPLDIHQYMRFGNIRFTRKEIITIRLLLSHCKVKEISYIQGCSEACEHKRILRIKEKLNCPHASSSSLFNALKENGITLACLETLVSYP